jgi:hypothetical protein
MLEIPLWIVGLLWALSAGADNLSFVHPDQGLKPVHPAPLPSQLVQVPFGGAARARTQAAYGRLPLGFESNQGQAEPSIRFLSRSTGTGLFFKTSEVILQLRNALPNPVDLDTRKELPPETQTQIHLLWLGARTDPEIVGEMPLARKSHYLAGDSHHWRFNVPNYSRIRYKAIYPGIDLVFYGNPELLEYDFVLSPGADPASIALHFEGLDPNIKEPSLSVDENGDLLLRTQVGLIRQHKPSAYQQTNDGRNAVASRYVLLKGGKTVGFELGTYDATQPVIIDPVLSYSVTGIGGSAIAVDAQGQAYVAGVANPAFVPTSGAFQTSPGGGTCVSGPNTIPCPDILIVKLNSTGTDLVYSTFLGGSGSDYAYGIAVDSAGSVYITGATSSTNFPVTPNALYPAHDRNTCGSIFPNTPCNNAFVTKLSTAGNALVYSTYLNGASGGVGSNAIAVDSLGQAYVTGDRPSGSFVTKLSASADAAIYSTAAVGGSAIAVDSTGNAYTTGRKGTDSFVSKLGPDGATVLYSFRLGGTFTSFSAPPEEVEALTGVAVDAAGNAYVTGYTAYKDFPTTPDAAFPAPQGLGICGNSLCRDAFVSKVNSAGTALVYSTFLGGDSIDYGTGIAVDSAGNAYVSGVTRSANFPNVHGASSISSGGAFVAKLNANGSALLFATTLGTGQTLEGASALAVDGTGSVFVTGTAGPSFPTTPGAFQPQVGANGGFVAKFFDDLQLFVPIVLSAAGQNNSFFTSELTLTNRSTREVVLEYTYTAAFGGGTGKVKDTLPAGQQRVVPDAINYLRLLGVPVSETGNRSGTLGVRFSGLNSASEGAVTVRITTPVSRGRVGLAYQSPPTGLTAPCYLFGLRQNTIDRSNVAIQNAGATSDGDITLRLTVFTGEPTFPWIRPVSLTLPEQTLAPGEFRQLTGILQSVSLSLSNGFVRVERIHGTAPYFAYGVVNDQVSSDGSFIAPVAEDFAASARGMTLPVIVQLGPFSTELVLTNRSAVTKVVQLAFVSDTVQAPDSTATVSVPVSGQEQLILPNIIQWMRQHGAAGLGSIDQTQVGALFLTVSEGNMGELYAGARTLTGSEGGGHYGVSYAAVPYGSAGLSSSRWIYGLQQNAENRGNLGLVNTGEIDNSLDRFRIELFDGENGQKVSTVESIEVGPRHQLQIGSLFEKYAPATHQGYVRVSRTSGTNPFITYSVLNDGASPGQRTGDGAFLSSSP